MLLSADPPAGLGALRAAQVASRLLSGDLILQSRTSGAWLRLTGTLREIWEALEYPVDLERLVAGFAARYRGAPGVVESGLLEGLDVLEQHGLLAPAPSPSAEARQRDRYLWLIKRALTNLIYPEHDLRIAFLEAEGAGLEEAARTRALRDIRIERPEAFRAVVDGKLTGREAKPRSHTVVGLFRLTGLERCAETALAAGVAGDFLEAGVGQGGAAIFLRALQEAHGVPARRTWLADSFQGPPPPAPSDAPYGLDLAEPKAPWLAFDQASVQEHFRRYDLLGPQVRFIGGWLADTLGAAETGPLALLRIDVDLFSSTTTVLEGLYDRVSPGGFVIVDDYGAVASCREAVDGFRQRRGITEPLHRTDAECVFWRKPA